MSKARLGSGSHFGRLAPPLAFEPSAISFSGSSERASFSGLFFANRHEKNGWKNKPQMIEVQTS